MNIKSLPRGALSKAVSRTNLATSASLGQWVQNVKDFYDKAPINFGSRKHQVDAANLPARAAKEFKAYQAGNPKGIFAFKFNVDGKATYALYAAYGVRVFNAQGKVVAIGAQRYGGGFDWSDSPSIKSLTAGPTRT